VRPVSAVGYMLENPVVSVRYSPIRAIGSDNPTVSDRVYHAGKSAGKTDLAMFVDLTAICAVKLTNVGEQNPQRPYAGPLLIRKRMRWSEPYGDIGRSAEMSDPTNQVVTAQSEIPCRVSSDLHEWRNDLGTVSTRDSAKLQYE
jgi:hypothetical protein